jgi:ketosteroid isomerase-like protein
MKPERSVGKWLRRLFRFGDHPVGIRDRQELVGQAFAALDNGDLDPFRRLLDPKAKWVAIPQGGDVTETPICASRAAIIDRLERLHTNGRRFQLGKMIEGGDRVAVEVTLLAPEWSGLR